MLKKLLIAGVVLIVLAGAGLWFWAHAIFASDTVREAVEAQLTKALGQPVAIGRMGAAIWPRVTMTLHDVRIGNPARITAARLDVGTNLRALLSRRIEHGSIALQEARVELPLPVFAVGSGTGADAESEPSLPIEIVSIDEILLEDAEIVGGGRTLQGDVDMMVEGAALTIRRAELDADGTTVSVTGRLDDMAGPTGELAVAAPSLDFARLLAFAADFASVATQGPNAAEAGGAPAAGPDPTPMNLSVSLEADRATFGTLAIDALTGRARVTPEAATIDPIGFRVFGGEYNGTLALTLSSAPEFRLDATVEGVDMAALTAYAGNPDVMTGMLSGRVNVAGRAASAGSALGSTGGRARVDIVNGSIRGLGLVEAVVLATSMRAGAAGKARLGDPTAPEPFSRLGAMLAIQGGTATTKDLRFESEDVLLDASGSFRLDGSQVDLSGRVQLSEALSQQAGRDLLRYTAENGRVTLPATVRGSLADLQVRVEVGSLLKRAIINRAEEEVKDAVKEGLGKILGR